jgi:hypothetical protein
MESPLEFTFRQPVDKCEFLYVCVAEKLNQLSERFGELGLLRAVERSLMEKAKEDSLHHDDMVQDPVQILVAQRFRMGLYGIQERLICPHLVAKERTKQIDHGVKPPRRREVRNARVGSTAIAHSRVSRER